MPRDNPLTLLLLVVGLAVLFIAGSLTVDELAKPVERSSDPRTRLFEDVEAYQTQMEKYAEFQREAEGQPVERQIAIAEAIGLPEIADALRNPKGAAPARGGCINPMSVVSLATGAAFVAGAAALRMRRHVRLFGDDPEPPTSAAPEPERLPERVQLAGAVRPHGDPLKGVGRGDPLWSPQAFFDYVHALHRHAHQRDWDLTGPAVASRARQEIERYASKCAALHDTLLRSLHVKLTAAGPWTELRAELAGLRIEQGRDGQPRVVEFTEGWELRRPETAMSLPPDKMLVFGCPSCQAKPADTDKDGRCVSCGALTAWGQQGWQLVRVKTRGRTPLQPGRYALRFAMGASAPLLRAHDLDDRVAELRRSGWTPEAFLADTQAFFLRWMSAGDTASITALEPRCTPFAVEQLRCRRPPYEVQEEQPTGPPEVQLAGIELDPFYEAATVRMWWTTPASSDSQSAYLTFRRPVDPPAGAWKLSSIQSVDDHHG